MSIHKITWPMLSDLFPVAFPGIHTNRDELLVDIDKSRLVQRMEQYFDPTLDHEDVSQILPGAMTSTPTFNAPAVRDQLLRRGFLAQNIVRYYYRPFDVRWLYWEPETKLLDRNRAEYFGHIFAGNQWIALQQRPRKGWSVPPVMRAAGSYDLMERGTNYCPLYLNHVAALLRNAPNLSAESGDYLDQLELEPTDLFFHAVAILHTPAYHRKVTESPLEEWPRIPLPKDREVVKTSAQAGQHIAALLDVETPVIGITIGVVSPEYQHIGNIAHSSAELLSMEAGEFALTAGWGHRGNDGQIVADRGSVVARDYTPDEIVSLQSGSASAEDLSPLGSHTCDVYLNEAIYWRNVPINVWKYSIGGYPVIKKWLSWRDYNLLGRSLTEDEVNEMTNIIRRITALILLETYLDSLYISTIRETISFTSQV
ncbi:MAG: type ISP restriction/modification enzyme [Chloroflexota bacterium]